MGEHDKDAPHHLALLVHLLAEHDVVDHGVCDRDRQRLLRAEPDRVLELLRVGKRRDVEDAHADAVAGDAEPDVLLRQLVLGEERLQRLRQGRRVTNLAGDHQSAVERRARELQQLGRTVVVARARLQAGTSRSAGRRRA